MNELMTIHFYGDQLLVAQEKQEIYVAVKPVSDRLGLDWSSQLKRIKRHKIMAEGVVMMTTPSAGGEQETLCLPLDLFCGWLVQIDLNRVNEQARPMIERYQREAFKAIAKHFSQQKDSALRAAEHRASIAEAAYFARYPTNRLIRAKAMSGEPYWYIARLVGCAAATVGNAVRRMIYWGLIDARLFAIARSGCGPLWAHRRKYRQQLDFGF